jgi:hypothetical protein
LQPSVGDAGAEQHVGEAVERRAQTSSGVHLEALADVRAACQSHVFAVVSFASLNAVVAGLPRIISSEAS